LPARIEQPRIVVSKARVKRKRQTTLTDIARFAGVAPMTVSRVVNSSGYVSSELRQRIEKAIVKLNYSPNRLARCLKGTPSNVIGVLLPDLKNPFSAELARGIEDALAVRGYFLFAISADQSGKRENAAIEAFSDHRVEGVVLAARCSSNPEDIARLARERFPVVVVGPDFRSDRIDHVTARYREGGFMATEHLIREGRRKIAFLGSALEDPQPLLRFRGYLDALAKWGMAADRNYIVAPSRVASWCSQQDGYECMNRLLAMRKIPDAVFARNDFVAIGALHAMNERGVSVPGDVAVVGFDNLSISAWSSPPLTTVAQSVYEQGRAAGAMLLDRIEGGERQPAREEEFPCELVIRQSSVCGQPFSADRITP
jgi:DNA-binding LacI/PurR family transcriptional regulator